MEFKTVDLILKNGEKLTVKIKTVISGNLKSKLISLIKKKPLNKLNVQYQEALKGFDNIETLTETQIGLKMLKTDVVSTEDLTRFIQGDYLPDNFEEYNDYLFEFMKQIVEPTIEFNDLKDDREFWMEQDIEMIEEVVNSFRSRIK